MPLLNENPLTVETFIDALRGAVLISGLVVVMMMLVECLNAWTGGRAFNGLRQNRFGRVLLSAFLGVIPGCMGGFASVSLYTHGMISFGALVAMMIASSGDEAFAMLAMFPQKALLIFGILFVLAVVVGLAVDFFCKGREIAPDYCCEAVVHEEDAVKHGERHFSGKRALLLSGVALFVAALLAGLLEHDHEADSAGLNLLSEDWMNIMFGVFCLALIVVIVRASDHFIDEHLWHHIVCRHLPKIFLWTFGVLLAVGFATRFVDIGNWISENTVLMIVFAALLGIIPESGPHLIFVTLFASGIVPLPVLVASCISQDGHAALPLLAESKRSFVKSKLIGCILAIVVGLVWVWIM